jgi:hypothetical protein
LNGACSFGSCVNGATVPLFFARAEDSGDFIDTAELPKKGIDSTCVLATWYWAACIGLALLLLVAVAKRYCSVPQMVTSHTAAAAAAAAACLVPDDGESIQVVCTPAKMPVRHSARVRRSTRPASI